MSLYAKKAHKRAAKALGYALTLGGFDAWRDASAIWSARLAPDERAAVAWAALTALSREDAEKVATGVLGGAGS
ncbi:hypothetical protein AB9K41_23665, partial [Cribrihabitans sp. XS_ASV171]